MKKLITISLLLPVLALAQSVSIDGIESEGQNFSASGTSEGGEVVIETEDEPLIVPINTLTVLLDGSPILSQGTGIWNVDSKAEFGEHTLTATVSAPDGSYPTSVSQTFRLTGPGGPPLQILDGTAPCFGLTGIFFENCVEQSYPNGTYCELKPRNACFGLPSSLCTPEPPQCL